MKGLMRKISILLVSVLAVKLCAELSFGDMRLAIPESLTRGIVSFELGSVSSAEAAAVTEPSPDVTAVPETLFAESTPPALAMPDILNGNGSRLTFSSDGTDVDNSVGAPTPAPSAEARLPDNYLPKIENQSAVEVDVMSLLADSPEITLYSDSPQILILHTHGSEAFTSTEGFRTLDKSLNIVRVGDALTTELQNRGFSVIHDRNIYDYPSYSGSYSRSGEAVQDWLRQYPTIQVVFDIHRDAVEKTDGTQYRTQFTPPGGFADTSQIMMMVTTGDKGLSHPDWQENMKFALDLQSATDALYPGLLRPLCISGQRYNEQLAPGYLLLEVGSTGNTVEEAAAAARLFADPVEQTLRDLIVS